MHLNLKLSLDFIWDILLDRKPMKYEIILSSIPLNL